MIQYNVWIPVVAAAAARADVVVVGDVDVTVLPSEHAWFVN